MFYIKMKNFSHLIHLGLFATQDSMDYLIHHINERADNLLCVAAVIENAVVIKTIMHHWEPEP